MTPNTMTLDEVRDELSRRDGWTREDPIENTGIYVWCKPHANYAVKEWCNCHPHPATLDGAAAALRNEGWGYFINRSWLHGKLNVYCEAVFIHGMPCPLARVMTEGPDELTARYRLALACRIAEEGK